MGKPKIHPNVWAAYITAAATVFAAVAATSPKMGCNSPKPAPTPVVDRKDPNNWTPLYRAARDNNAASVKQLLDQGADPNTPDRHGWTPIFQAARHGNSAMVRDLMDKGAAVDVESDLKETPLHLAAESGNAETIRTVALSKSDFNLGQGADVTPVVNVNAEDAHGRRPLHYAAKSGSLDAVKLLLELGAEDSKDEDGHTAEELADNGKVRDAIRDAKPKQPKGNPFKIRL